MRVEKFAGYVRTHQEKGFGCHRAGFDGSVPVPKPNKLFAGRLRPFHQGCPVVASNIYVSEVPVSREAAVAADVREKQKQLASMLQDSETVTKPSKSI